MDPDSSNYIVKVIGDEFQTVNNDGEITSYGDYPNLSQHIRIGDYKEDIFESNPSLQPMGYVPVLDPIKSIYLLLFHQLLLIVVKLYLVFLLNTYKEDLPYGFDPRFGDDELEK